MTSTLAPPPLRWDGERLHVLDQTRLPAREEVLVLAGAEDTAQAIERLAGARRAADRRRGRLRARDGGRARADARRARARRRAARDAAARRPATSPGRSSACAPPPWPPARSRLAGAARAEAEAIQREDEAASAALAAHGAALLDARCPTAPVTIDDALQLGRARRIGPRDRARRDRRARRPAARARARVRGAAAAPGRAADGLGARAARDRARARRRRRRRRADPHAGRSTPS